MQSVIRTIELEKDGLPAKLVLYKESQVNFRYYIVQKYRIAGRVLDRKSDFDAGFNLDMASAKVETSLKAFMKRGFILKCQEEGS